MNIFIVVRESVTDPEFNSIQVFYSAHLTRQGAEDAVERYREIPWWGEEPDFVILEKAIE